MTETLLHYFYRESFIKIFLSSSRIASRLSSRTFSRTSSCSTSLHLFHLATRKRSKAFQFRLIRLFSVNGNNPYNVRRH